MNKETLREKMKHEIFHGDAIGEEGVMDRVMSLISQSESKETDSNEVKELVEIMVKEHDNLTNDPRTRKTAQAILKAGYTKNKGEKVYEGDASIPDIDDMAKWLDKYDEKNIQVFIRERHE